MEQFDFNDVGKRMPYQVPDGFFSSMEEKIMQQVADNPMEEAPVHSKSRVKILWRTLISTAAVAAIVIGLWVKRFLIIFKTFFIWIFRYFLKRS